MMWAMKRLLTVLVAAVMLVLAVGCYQKSNNALDLYNRGYDHGAQGDYAAAIADYTLVVESYSADADPAMREQVAKALYNRGYAHYD